MLTTDSTILNFHVDTDDGFSCDVVTDLVDGEGAQLVTLCTRGSCDKRDDVPKLVLTVNDSLALRRRLLDDLIDYPGTHADHMPEYFDRLTKAVLRVNLGFEDHRAASRSKASTNPKSQRNKRRNASMTRRS